MTLITPYDAGWLTYSRLTDLLSPHVQTEDLDPYCLDVLLAH